MIWKELALTWATHFGGGGVIGAFCAEELVPTVLGTGWDAVVITRATLPHIQVSCKGTERGHCHQSHGLRWLTHYNWSVTGFYFTSYRSKQTWPLFLISQFWWPVHVIKYICIPWFFVMCFRHFVYSHCPIPSGQIHTIMYCLSPGHIRVTIAVQGFCNGYFGEITKVRKGLKTYC